MNIVNKDITRNYNKTVIMAEDTTINIMMITNILKKLGIKVIIANNGQTAMEHAQSHDHSLILMDCQMPVMDGETATKKLREEGYKKPIIAMTANGFVEDKIRYIAIGMTDYIIKPFRIEDLVEVLDKYLK